MFNDLFSFPNPVNEVSARLVAGGVALLALATIVFDQPWLTLAIAYGFLARTLTGPTLSPLGQLVTRVITPRLGVAGRHAAPDDLQIMIQRLARDQFSVRGQHGRRGRRQRLFIL